MKFKSPILTLAIASLLLCNPPIPAQDQKEKPVIAAPDKSAPMNDAEKKFKDLLTNVILQGRWCSIKDGQLGPEKEDKYTIVSVAKVKDSSWVISTRMKYKDREFVAPLPIEVQWAGDTAVIVVNNMTVPGGGTYSARVLFYEKTYAGSWTGGDHGGLLNGIIVANKD